MKHAAETEKLFQQVLNDMPQAIKLQVDWSFDIADRIDSRLRALGISQKELARRLGTSEAAVSKWVGGNHNFTLSTLARISDALGGPIISVVS